MIQDAIITRCPACATTFRASESQTAARDGQVRCGRCSTIFDAWAHALAAGVPATPEVEEKPAQASLSEPAVPEALVLAPAPAEDPATPDDTLDDTFAPAPVTSTSTFEDGNLELDFGKTRKNVALLSPWVAWPGLAVLAFLLVAQSAYYFRGDLVLLFPQTKPFAEDLCINLGCDLPLPRKPEMMSIESSDLQADTVNPSVMVLSATLRNRAPFPQSPPALELTLTDLQDQPVARRVLNAADYLPRGLAGSATTGNLFPAGSEMPVKVFFEASSVKATGYRLYLFYP